MYSPVRKSKRSNTMLNSPAKSSSPLRASTQSKRVVMIHPKADEFEGRGLTSQEVQLDHIGTLKGELERERGITKGLQKDVAMLRA